MKVLLTGPDGQAGRALRASVPTWAELSYARHNDLDICDEVAVRRYIEEVQPDLVINAAAYTDVDGAEANRDQAFAVNADGVGHLAAAVKHINSRLTHISTDYVFDGTLACPLAPESEAHPVSVYGDSKLAGEDAMIAILSDDALVIRTSWLYYRGGRNFVNTMLRLMTDKESVRVIADQVGSPCWAGSLADAIWVSVEKQLAGTYHWRDAGIASWYDFAVAIAEIGLDTGLLDHEIDVIPVRTEEYPTTARRPAYSVLDTSRLETEIGMRASYWRRNLRTMLEQLKNE